MLKATKVLGEFYPDADRMNKLVFTVMRGLGEFPVGICNAALRFYVGKKCLKYFISSAV